MLRRLTGLPTAATGCDGLDTAVPSECRTSSLARSTSSFCLRSCLHSTTQHINTLRAQHVSMRGTSRAGLMLVVEHEAEGAVPHHSMHNMNPRPTRADQHNSAYVAHCIIAAQKSHHSCCFVLALLRGLA